MANAQIVAADLGQTRGADQRLEAPGDPIGMQQAADLVTEHERVVSV